MKLLSTLILTALMLEPWSKAMAVDGVSVTVHWAGVNHNYWGGYGQVIRHDIANSLVIKRQTLYSGNAREAVISPDGARVAFLKDTGMLSVMSIEGGEVLELAQSDGTAHLDWPQQDWIFYNRGGIDQPEGSRVINAVNPQTGGIREIVVLNRGVWRFFIARDLRRAVVRVDDQDIVPNMTIIAYDLIEGQGILSPDRSPARPSCGTGMDPSGTYFIMGWPDAHLGLDILDWETFAQVKTFSHLEALSWGDSTDSGISHNRNNWSVNSSKWIAIHLGWGWRGIEGANQVLYNWVDEERLVVTENGPGSFEFDSAGDFFIKPGTVDPLSPVIRYQPVNVAVLQGHDVTLSVIAAGGTALTYQWQKEGQNIPGATAPALVLKGVPLNLSGTRYRCLITSSEGMLTSDTAVLYVTEVANQPPAVKVEPELKVFAQAEVFLNGHVEDDGLPLGQLTLKWRMITGPREPQIENPDQPMTKVVFEERGSYVMRLEASDGVVTNHEDQMVTVHEKAIAVVTPEAGDSLTPGSTQIYWRTSAAEIDKVELEYSLDGQKSWNTLGTVAREADNWGDVQWDVPAQASSEGFIRITSVGAAPGYQALAGPFTVVYDGGCAVPGADPFSRSTTVILAATCLLILFGFKRCPR